MIAIARLIVWLLTNLSVAEKGKAEVIGTLGVRRRKGAFEAPSKPTQQKSDAIL